jgi:hypothetical protein
MVEKLEKGEGLEKKVEDEDGSERVERVEGEKAMEV